MALKRDRNFTPAPDKQNRYLTDPVQGMELVSRIISADTACLTKDHRDLDRLIDKTLLFHAGVLHHKDELELRARLLALSDRLMLPMQHQLLQNRAVIGIGGKFSAGKSCFINSLLGSGRSLLPENQSPSTAVPTYILAGEEEAFHAYLNSGAQIRLDDQAVTAISHDFQTTYGLGLGQYLSFITVTTQNFKWSNIALLDTPGYNKSDSTVIESYSDSQKAHVQLRSIDYLIWLIDVTNGTLTQDDYKFIDNLKLSSEVLIVLNKCDIRTLSECEKVRERVLIDAQQMGIRVYDVVLYSAQDPEQYPGREKIQQFFEHAQTYSAEVKDPQEQLQQIIHKLLFDFVDREHELKAQRDRIGDAIFRSLNIKHIESLISMYSDLNVQIRLLQKNEWQLKQTQDKIKQKIDRIKEPYCQKGGVSFG